MSIQTNIISASLFRGMDANLTGSLIAPSITGSLYGTASYAETLGGLTSASYVRKDLTDSDTQDINGSLKLTGDIIAENYIISSSVLYVTTSFSSGSTRWGDSSTDTHQVTGSLLVTGSVGIDTNNLTEKLTIANNTKFTSLTTGGASGASLWTDTSNRAAFGNSLTNSETWITKRGASGVIKLGEYDFSATYITMLANGRVGIGTTSPSAQLHVSASGTTNDLLIGTNKLFVSASGNVGIGTLNPTYQLEISSSNATLIKASRSGGIGTIRIDAGAGISIGNDVTHATNGKLQFFTNGQAATPMITLTSDYKMGVGIGSTSPSFGLDVSGSTRITNNLTVSGSTILTGSLSLTGSANITNALTSSTALISGSGVNRLTVIGSGSSSPLFTVQGSQGELFSINDSLSGSLFSVSDISGLPILEVFSDDTIVMGDYTAPSLYTTAKYTTTNSGSFTIYQNIPTASYDAAYFDYFISSGSNKRAGQIVAVRNATTMSVSEITTADFGDTSDIQLTVIVTGSNMALTGSAPTTSPWVIKSIIKAV